MKYAEFQAKKLALQYTMIENFEFFYPKTNSILGIYFSFLGKQNFKNNNGRKMKDEIEKTDINVSSSALNI